MVLIIYNICSLLQSLIVFTLLNSCLTVDEEYMPTVFSYLSRYQGPILAVSPSWESVPYTTVDVSEENVAELYCLAVGQPPPLVQWSFNAIPLHELDQNERRLLLDGGRVLRIRDLNHDVDSGLYQCNATNFLGHIAAATYLNVQASAPRFKMSDQRIWKVIRQSRVDMNCDVDAAPKPVVRWVDANDSLIAVVPGKIELFPNNYTLRIHEVNNADEGFYYCNVSNKYGINRAMNKLEVYKPSYFAEVPSPPKIILDAFETVELRCEAVSDSRLSVSYLWTHNGKPIKTAPFLDEGGVSHLKLLGVRGRASGRIECTAITDVDVKKSGVDLLVRDVPEAPTLLKVECSYLAQQQALIVWRSAEGSNPTAETITHFSVEMITGFQRVEVNQRGEPPKWSVVYEERELHDRDLFKFILPLSPWVNYTFRVVAHNFYGSSPPVVSAENVCSTPPDVPHKSPSGVKVFGTEPDNLVIHWTPMEKVDWNAPGLRYLIRYRIKSARMIGEEEEKWHEFFVEDPMVNETIIRDQPTFEAYEVQVRAVNSEGYSALPPPLAVGFSGEDFPKLPPKNLRIEGFHNYSTVLLAWDGVEESSVRGHFKGYKLIYWLTAQPYFSNYLTVDKSSQKTAIDGLDAIQNYTVKVHVINGQYESQPSNLVQFRTPEGAPSKVHDLRARAVGANSIFVTWQAPLHTNGNIRGYFITFENSTSGFVEETYVLHRQMYYLHEFLVPDSPYKVAVWAETNGGEGPKVVKAIRTWPIRDPDPPQFTVQSTAPTVIHVEWLPMANLTLWRMSGTTFQVKYRRQSSSHWHLTEPISLPHTEMDIQGLEESTDYSIVGVAREGLYRLKESTLLSFRTDSRRRVSHINPEKLRNAAWFIAVLFALAIALLIIAIMCYIAQRRHGSGLYSVKDKFSSQARYSSVRSGSSTADSNTTDFLDDKGEEHKKFLEEFQNTKKVFSTAGRALQHRARKVRSLVTIEEKPGDVVGKKEWITPKSAESVLLQLPKK